ncbi:uncharacterized protein LOC130815209 isoform X1 [Amaranthus tricolor]|uniref:uncharacterized protein LOC130815209 isoform X1 n=1 Tax=Amaranthus tricolor TaxID=29722 RepID=UPI00258C55C0|nr:uncharacterized protein LOC130815209 isoform X1 [Amaranthus tricolor]
MSNFLDQLNQIKSLISSSSKSEKSFAYSTLQHLQELSNSDDSLIQFLVDHNIAFLSSIVSDICIDDADEEIFSLALKCLGFIMYHPSLVAATPKEYVDRVLESQARLITKTKIKVVCNLAVWCISVQQLDASSLASHFDPLLRAIVHSLDNPFGSLSTTFEAIQAVMKLATQLSEKMRDKSSIWAPPIYRRLLSADKRERDMCLRCLLKVKCLLIPAQLSLSKAIAQDIKLRLLTGMDEMIKRNKKVQVIEAWGWFIRILGHYSLKCRYLVNELLKIPEQTFSDPDPQVQVATQVAWEGLIDALVCLPPKVKDTSQVSEGIAQNLALSKSLKLIMTPVIGVMTGKAALCVQLSCLNTWCYLLHKLDSLINDPQILQIVVEPMFKVIFNFGLEDGNLWMWSLCMDLLFDCIQARTVSYGSDTLDSGKLLPRTTDKVSRLSKESALKNYSVTWLSWDCSRIDFLVRMIQKIFCQAATTTLCPEKKRLVCDAALRTFDSFLKGVHVNFEKPSTSNETVMQSIKAILMFVKSVYDTAFSVVDPTNDFQLLCLHSLEAVIQELDPSILGSPLYKVVLDIKDISEGEVGLKVLKEISPINFIDMVPPIIYLIVHHLHLLVQLSYKTANTGSIIQKAHKFYCRVLCSYDSLAVIHAVSLMLYGRSDDGCIKIWILFALCLKEYIDGVKDLMPLQVPPASTGSLTVCYFLIYPLVYSFQKSISPQKECNSLTTSLFFSTSPLCDQATDVWMSLYCLLNSSNMQEFQSKNSFAEDLCSSLNGFFLQSEISEVLNEVNFCDYSRESHIFVLCGNLARCIILNLHIEKVTPEGIKCGYNSSSGINNCLEFIIRLMNFLSTSKEATDHMLSRMLTPLTSLVSRLQWKDDILSVFKVLCDSLLHWLSDNVINSDEIRNQLPLLWTEIIRSLQRSWPTIVYDSSFLKLQAPLLKKTLDHPNPSISGPTVTFWNSAYGDQAHLDIPPHLHHVLDKLSRLGKIKIRNKRTPVVQKYSSNSEATISRPKLNVKATLNTCSKRVELLGNIMDGSPCKRKLLPPCPKRKRSELTDHQKEVRKAQQGKLRDCSGHGPGVRTYTNADFSQGSNYEDSQDSQDVRDPELILDLLRKTC